MKHATLYAAALLAANIVVVHGAAPPARPGDAHASDARDMFRTDALDRTVPLVFADRSGGFSGSLVRQVRKEATRIWKRAGVTLAWNSTVPSCVGPLYVSMESASAQMVGHHAPMGSILFADGEPTQTIQLSVGTVETLFREGAVPEGAPGFHEMLVARALGRTLAHEIGHYLLREETHTAKGLMRATWPIQEAASDDQRGFDLSREQREIVIDRLDEEQESCGEK